MMTILCACVVQTSSLTARTPPTAVTVRRETAGNQLDETTTNQHSASPTVRGSDDSGFEDFPVIDQNTSAAGLSLVRRK